MKVWNRFIDKYPENEDFPIWIYDDEFNDLELVKVREDRIFVRQSCVKDELLWQKAEFNKPIIPQMKVYKVAEADGLCYKCKKHIMKDCECFFGKLFIDNQPERLSEKTSKEDATV